ncbi:MAG: electron transfer flavoprotein subunit beta [Chloroflexi bacterium]|nr:electron transfer flavoprotein subunit beta [Chloroflexota bacterium]
MNYIVLVKQVPDIKNIPNEAWDWEKGTLKRGYLDNVCNELDKQALAFVLKMKERQPGQLVGLSMGPPFAEEVLRYALSAGADAGVLLTDRKLGGADTAATAYPLGQAIRKIERELFNGDRNYIIVTGMQSVDGDTAQVPPQIAEELGIAHIAYATSFGIDGTELVVSRITRRGAQTIAPASFPCVITVTSWTEPPNASFSRTRWASMQKLHQWSAADINAEESRIGLTGSRTTVYRIFSPKELSKKKCRFENDLGKLAAMLKEAYSKNLGAADADEKEPAYRLPEGKEPAYRGEVWVYAEQEGGDINAASLELLGKASKLARQLGENVGAVLVGQGVKESAGELIAHGADKVYLVEHDLLDAFLPLPYTKAVAGLVEKYQPQMMLFSATPLGRGLAPRVAYRSNSGLTADCTELDLVDFKRGKQELFAVLRQTRPALGGNIMASIITQNSRVQMATARPGVMRALKPDFQRRGEIIEYSVDITVADLGARVISTEVRPSSSELKDAAVIVCGGAGCKTKDGFDKYIRSLAESLGPSLGVEAMIGASRAAVESGFISRSHQIGQTGQTVKPRIYVGVGVSGAVQHITGMQHADIVLAVNRDPNAPIFRVADFGVIGNLEEVVPGLIEALNQKGR